MLRVVWIVDLLVILAVAVSVLLASPDVATYEADRERAWWVVGVGTVVHFACADGELRRRKAHTRRALHGHASQRPGGSRVQPA